MSPSFVLRKAGMFTELTNVLMLLIFQDWKSFCLIQTFKFEKIDICDIKRLVECDYFINTAAESHVDNSIRKSDIFLHSNVNGVHNILEL